MGDKIGNNITGTRNQAKMPEGEDVDVKATLDFRILWDGDVQTDDEWKKFIADYIHDMSKHEIISALVDYEVD